jgi:hypothetical protein
MTQDKLLLKSLILLHMVVWCMLNAFQTPDRKHSEKLVEELFHSAGLFVVELVESFADGIDVASIEYMLFFPEETVE